VLNVGWPEILMLGLIGFLVLGPERLPKYAADAARLIRQLRKMATDASADLRADLGPEMPDLHLADLANPRRMVARYLLEPGEEAELDGYADGDGDADRRDGRRLRRPSGPPLAVGELPPYDVDAT
jgi:sec-independent protein translocase protein TatB